jgi:hypothetical protein
VCVIFDVLCWQVVVREFDLQSAAILLYRDQRRQEPVESSRLKSLAAAGLKHGDRLYMFPKSKTDQVGNSADPPPPPLPLGAVIG